MDISQIDINYIQNFDICYITAAYLFDVEPINAPAKLKRKIRKWAEKNYIDGIDLPEEIVNFTGKEASRLFKNYFKY